MKSNLKSHQKTPFLSARDLAVDIASTLGIIITPQTIRNNLRDANIRGRAPLNKPLISEINRAKRLEFAILMSANHYSFGDMLFYSDESKFNTFVLDGKKNCHENQKRLFKLKI